jgi:hypothetical protein
VEQSQPDEQSKPEQPPVVPSAPEVPEAGPQVGPGGAAGGPVKRRRSWKMVLLVVASVMGVLCSGTVGYGLWWYNQETKPDRSAPDVVVSNYLRALLVDRDDSQVGLYSCSDTASLVQISDLKHDIEGREDRFKTRFRASWGELKTAGTGSQRQVEVSIRLSTSIDGFPQTDIQTWQFDVKDEGDWRVCGAKRLA